MSMCPEYGETLKRTLGYNNTKKQMFGDPSPMYRCFFLAARRARGAMPYVCVKHDAASGASQD